MPRRQQEQHRGAGGPQGCCTEGKCGRTRAPDFWKTLQDDVFVTANDEAGAVTEMRAHKSQTTGSERGSIGDEERRSPSGGGARRWERVEERGAGEAAQDGEPLAGVATGARAGAASAHVHTMSNFNELHIGSELYNVEKGLPPSEGVEENKEMEASEGRGRSKCDDDAPEPEGSKRLWWGGCNSLKHREAFEAEQWTKAEAWSRAAARRCTQCLTPTR